MTDLRAAGLTPRALASWLGTTHLAALPARLARPRPPLTPASALLELTVAGTVVPRRWVRAVPDALLEDVDDDHVRCRHALLPLGPAIVACDRLDAAPHPHLVCPPDDSSYHLAGALPAGRRATWLDLGCGSAVAPLARPELAQALVGLDLNAHAIELATLGARLSAIARFAGIVGDIATPLPAAELVTCNAPMPDGGTVQWRSTDASFFARLFAAVPARVASGGLAVIHVARDAIPADLPGERIVVRYTPPDAGVAFAVLWWRPDARPAFVERHRALTPERPHLDALDREVLASGR